MSQLPVQAQNKYITKAISVARIVQTVLANRPGTDPEMIEGWKLVRTKAGSVWLFAILDDRRLPKFEPYVAAVHHLSSSLRGMPVILGNHTGLRFCILLSEPPHLPEKANYPGWQKGIMQLGIGPRGPVGIGYGEITHTLVAGITQYGKSNLLRLMALQALAEGWQLALADPDGRTFSKFEGNPALIMPVGATIDTCGHVTGFVQEIINTRAQLYGQAANSPDSLDEYNAWARGADKVELKPVLCILDEFNGTVMATGGARGSFAMAATQIAWRAAKFGVRLVLAGQDFSKDIVGPVREQMSTRICLRVANERTSDIVLGRTGAEGLTLPGRAMTNRWGTIQTYFVSKEMMAKRDGNGLTAEEQQIVTHLWKTNNGRMTVIALVEFGMGERQARRLRDEWKERGLAEINPNQDNALCLTVKMPVQAGLDGLDAVWTGLDAQAGLDGSGVLEA